MSSSIISRPPLVNVDGQPTIPVKVLNLNGEPIPVDQTTRGETKFEYNEVSSTGEEILTVIDLTVGVGVGADLVSVKCSGDNVSIFTVEINSVVKAKTRLTWNLFNDLIDLNFKTLSEGDNIKIKVENKRNKAGDFNATLTYNEFTV